jgi:hypothetical protein
MKKWFASIATSLLLATSISTVASADESNDKDCGDFGTYDEVVAYWNENGYTATNDPDNLDGRGKSVDDGIPCEVPSGYDTSKINGLAVKEEEPAEQPAPVVEKEEVVVPENNSSDDKNETVKEEKDEEKTTESSKEAAVTSTDDKEKSTSEENKSSQEEGEALPDTASNEPLMLLVSVVVAGLGLVMLLAPKKRRI